MGNLFASPILCTIETETHGALMSKSQLKRINPIIFTSRPVAMQRLSDCVGNGYSAWCTGSIPAMRCVKLISKFDLNYHVLADRNERARRKRAGLGNAQLVLWFNQDVIRWWLLITPQAVGDHAAHSLERLQNALAQEERIEIDGYELVRLSRKGQEKPSLTWRMTEHKYQGWRQSVIDTVRSRSHHSMHHMLYSLWSSPGFAGIRSQIGKIAALYRAEVKRSGNKDAPMPPKRLSYVRRLKHDGLTLSQLFNTSIATKTPEAASI